MAEHKQSNSMFNKSNNDIKTRLQNELRSLRLAQVPGISACAEVSNKLKWIVTMHGPANTLYAAHVYRLSLEFNEYFPYVAPVIKFITPIFHPNVDPKGALNLDVIDCKWLDFYDVRILLVSIQSLLCQPNALAPMNAFAAQMWKEPQEFKQFLDAYYAMNKDTAY